MYRTTHRIIIIVALFLSMVVLPISAHEGRSVGEFNLVFGWRNEPAYAGMMNGPEIFLSLTADHGHDDHSGGDHSSHGSDHGDDHHEEAKIDLASLDVSLRAEVTFGNQTTTITFRRAWGTDDQFIADLIPVLPGDYTFRVFGTIGDTEVDETFSSADGQFSTVEPASDIMFPVLPVVDEARIAALEARIAQLEALLAEMQDN